MTYNRIVWLDEALCHARGIYTKARDLNSAPVNIASYRVWLDYNLCYDCLRMAVQIQCVEDDHGVGTFLCFT